MAFGSTIGALASLVSTGITIANAVKGGPKLPTPTQPTKDPSIDVFRRQNQSQMAPGAALAGISSTAAGGTAGNGGQVGVSTLLGQ